MTAVTVMANRSACPHCGGLIVPGTGHLPIVETRRRSPDAGMVLRGPSVSATARPPAHRCPFLRAIDDGRPDEAARLAMSDKHGDPAEPAIVPVLLNWGGAYLDGDIDLAFLGLEGLHGAPAGVSGPETEPGE